MGAVLQLFRDLGTGKLAALISVAVLFVIGFIAISVQVSSPSLSAIYSNLDLKDSAAIVTELEAKNIDYELRANGTQIMVPQDQVLRLRMTMAQKGIPSKGSIVGYEIFDQSETLGTSSFVQNVNLIRALEGELGRTIGTFNNIESARIHLVIPKREIFSRDKELPSASVILQMRGSSSLTKEEVNAISHLVATAVPGLTPAKITIVDTKGKSFKLGARDENDPDSLASTSEDFKTSYENRLRNTIEELLEKSVGVGKVKAQVTSEINFDRIVTNSEIYDPDGQVVRSVQTVEEKESSTDKDLNSNVSVANNVPGGKPTEDGTKSATNNARTDETTNYEISKTVKNHVSEIGNVKRISIAVLVDGTYITDEKTSETTYTPRTEAELKQLEALVKSAVGFDTKRNDKVEIVNMQFYKDKDADKTETTMDWLKREFRGLIQTFVIAIVVIMVLLLVVRPIVARAFELSSHEEEEKELEESLSASRLAAPVPNIGEGAGDDDMIDIERIGARVNSSAFKSVNEIVEKYPDETVNIIRKWLNKE